MEHLINTFKFFSDESRLRIVMLLSEDKFCVCEISDILELPQPIVSKALSKLRDLTLVKCNRCEKYIYYELKKDNDLFMTIVNDIMQKLDDYPILSNDKNRIYQKSTYKKECCSARF